MLQLLNNGMLTEWHKTKADYSDAFVELNFPGSAFVPISTKIFLSLKSFML